MSGANTETPTDRFRATPLRGTGQRLVHVGAVVAGWALFLWGWADVLSQSWDIELLSWLIAGSAIDAGGFQSAYLGLACLAIISSLLSRALPTGS